MSTRLLMVGGALVLAACGTTADRPADAAVETAPSAEVAAGPVTQSDVDRAVEIANAIAQRPGSVDSILVVHALSVAGLEALMLKVSTDSGASAEYVRRTSR
jgi:hypothetical protein